MISSVCIIKVPSPPTLLVRMSVGTATVENSMEVPQKTKNRVTIWSSNLTPGHISRQNYNSKRYMHLCVHSSTIYSSQDMETTSILTDRWMHKEDVVHIRNGILFSHKKEWNNAIRSHMDGPRHYHTKWSKSDKEKQIYNIAYMWNLNNKWKKWTYFQNRLTNTNL